MTIQKTLLTKEIKRTIVVFAVLLAVGCALIGLGLRSDAAAVAHRIKSGVLTADEVAVAFENVSGRLVGHKVKESDRVAVGDVLLEMDETDLTLTLATLRATLESLRAQLTKLEHDYEVAVAQTNLQETSQWRNIELLEATRKAAAASLDLAKTEYRRAEKLSRAKAVAESEFDRALYARQCPV